MSYYIESSREEREKAVQFFLAQNERQAREQAAFETSPAGRSMDRLVRRMGHVGPYYKPCGVATRKAGE